MRGRHLLLVLSLLTAASCQGPAPAPGGRPEVKGRVEDSNGKPLARVAVKFFPLDEKNKGESLICITQKDGSFTGQCPAGRYKVTLLGVPAAPPKAEEKGKEKPALPAPSLPPGVPERYGSIKETPWEVDVPAQGKNGIVLKVEES